MGTGRWGRQPHSAARVKNKLVSLHTMVQLLAHAASTYKCLLITINNMVLLACSFPCHSNTPQGPAEVLCHIAQHFPLSAAAQESELQCPFGSGFILLPDTFSLAVLLLSFAEGLFGEMGGGGVVAKAVQ